jgi:hypothetical protein
LTLGRRAIALRIKPNQQLAAAKVEHRPFDHRRLREHQGHSLPGVEAGLVLVRQFAEGRARAVEQRLPADLAAPLLQALTLDPGGLVVVERIIDTVLIQPGARLFHGVAVLDAVDRDGFGHARSLRGHGVP